MILTFAFTLIIHMFTREEAQLLDSKDPLALLRNQFRLPTDSDGAPLLYFCGNSLGLQPVKAEEYVLREMRDWARHGVEGHLHAHFPWVRYHEFLTEPMAQVVGALPHEVIVMNTLSVNLHLMMVSFFRPTKLRHKILIEYSAFPSDRYAVESQIRYHGFNPDDSLIVLEPDKAGEYVSSEAIEEIFTQHGEEIALVLIGSVNYYTGQAYPLKQITTLARKYGCNVGFDLAHGAGNLKLNLHEIAPDFAVWCSYKYLNSGPGSLSGCFIHEQHADNFNLPRFIGWWAHDKINRFKMSPNLKLMRGAEGWQLSNPPILPMACMMASLEIFEQAGMDALYEKSGQLTGMLIQLLDSIDNPSINILSPVNRDERGAQVSIQVTNADRSIYDKISSSGIIADWREPDVIRVAPVPLYNTFEEVYNFYDTLKQILTSYE